MKIKLHHVFAAALTTLLCSCVGTTLKHSWKSPTYHGGPVRKVAVVAADPRENVRFVLEGQFVTQLTAHGVAAFPTQKIMSVAEMKADRKAAAAKFRELGADSVLIIRMVNSTVQAGSGRETPAGAAGGSGLMAGYDTSGSFDVYWIAYVPPDLLQTDMVRDVYLETSLFELKDGQRLWSGLTETVLTESTDKLELVRPLVTTVMTAMRKDGVVQ